MSGTKNFVFLTIDKFPTTVEVDTFQTTCVGNSINMNHVKSVVKLT